MRAGAVILAAGASRRMGQAKQMLPLGGSTVLGRTLEAALRSRVDEIVLVLGFCAASILETLPRSTLDRVKTIVNPNYEHGMAGSLQMGISALDSRSTAALILLGDQPLVRTDTLDRIIEAHIGTQAWIVIPTYHGDRGNPVLIARALFPEIMQLRGDTGCRAIFGAHPEQIAKIEIEDEGILLDVDSREDYERLRRLSEFAE